MGSQFLSSHKVYTSSVRPIKEHASTSWGTATSTNKSRLGVIQNLGHGMVLGAMKTTRIREKMEKAVDIEPLDNRRQGKVVQQSEKMRKLPSHPLHVRLREGTLNGIEEKA